MIINPIEFLVRQYTRAELPGWGRVYEIFIGGFAKNARWRGRKPEIIRDKVDGYVRILNIEEWADRSFYFLGRWYDRAATMAVKAVLRPGDTVLDVGANYGHFTMTSAATVGPQGSVHAMEPNPTSFARLTMHVTLNNLAHVDVHNVGVADAPQTLTLQIPRINSGEASFTQLIYDDYREVSCPVTTVDAIADGGPVDMLKIDVEGFETAVLKGASRTLADNRPIVMTELIDKHLARADTSKAEVFEILGALDYQAYRIECVRQGLSYALVLTPFAADGPDGDAIWVHPSRKDRFAGILPT